MSDPRARLSGLAAAALILFAPPTPEVQAQIVISTLEEIAVHFESVPCKLGDRLEAVRELFLQYEAPPEAIRIEEYGNAENLVLEHGTNFPETVVVGGHYDMTEYGCGAVDNWTGIVVLANLYRSIRTMDISRRVLFVAFGSEEIGLVGSWGMARAIPDATLDTYCAMVNVDSFGLGAPHSLDGASSQSLSDLAAEVAEGMRIPFANIIIRNADSDSSSFIRRGIPAVTLSGLSDDWGSILHTIRDRPDQINPTSVYYGYRLALAVWNRIDQAPCDAYR